MKEINIRIALRNNILLKLMNNNNIFTAAELSRRTGVSEVNIGCLLNLKEGFPFTKTGYSKCAIVIAEYFKLLPEDVFPRKLYSLKKTKAETEISIDSLPALSFIDNPELNYERKLLKDGLNKALDTLGERNKGVLLLRLEGKTLEECGEKYNVSKEYIRQIEAKSIRLLRNPKRAKYYKDYAESFGYRI